jgi:hypothetical protein
MQLTFTKGAGKFDVLQIERGGSAVQRVECPKQRIIPHDMVHYAVEHVLHKRGFLGRIEAGEVAGFGMQGDAESDSVERLVEVFQGDAWSGGRSGIAELVEMYAVTCAARGCPALPLDEASIAAIRATLADLTRRWETTAVGGSLVLSL